MTRVAMYVRVSTKDQTTEHQQRELEAVALGRGWDVVKVYRDHGISGTKGRDKRPALDEMMNDATRGKFDMIAVWSMDRLGRSLPGLVQMLADLTAIKCGVYFHTQNVDSSTPSGQAFLGMAAVFAQFERAMIVERVNAGLATARAKGVTLGRPRIDASREQQIRALAAQGIGRLRIAKQVGCGVSAVQRVLGKAVAG